MDLNAATRNLPPWFLNIFKHINVNIGGVIARMSCIHESDQIGGVGIPNCSAPLYHSLDFELLKRNSKLQKKLSSPGQSVHFFLGCHIWNPGELEAQINSGL
jgi:hypothetical protein